MNCYRGNIEKPGTWFEFIPQWMSTVDSPRSTVMQIWGSLVFLCATLCIPSWNFVTPHFETLIRDTNLGWLLHLLVAPSIPLVSTPLNQRDFSFGPRTSGLPVYLNETTCPVLTDSSHANAIRKLFTASSI